MNERKQQNEKERTFLSGCKARITLFPLNGISQLSTSWWINFILRKKISYSEYCRVRSDGGSLIALGRKIPDLSYIVAKLTTFCLGRSPQMRWSSAAKEMNTDEWHIHDLRTATYRDLSTYLNGTRDNFNEIILYFFSFGKDTVQINFFGTKRCLASEDT